MRASACRSARAAPAAPELVYAVRHAKNGGVFGYHSPAARRSFAFLFERKEHAGVARKYAYMQPYLRESFLSGQYVLPKNLDDARIVVRPMDIKQLVIQGFMLNDAERYFELYGMGTVCIGELRHTKRTVVLRASGGPRGRDGYQSSDEESSCRLQDAPGGIDWRAISLDMLYYDPGNHSL